MADVKGKQGETQARTTDNTGGFRRAARPSPSLYLKGMTLEFQAGLVLFRRDLRLSDQSALHHALSRCAKVWCVFVFDTDILDLFLAAGQREDRRVEFIHAALAELDAGLRSAGGGLLVRHGRPQALIQTLAAELGADSVWANHDYEPAALASDAAVAERLQADGRVLMTAKDQVVFEKSEILTAQDKPFSVFTPYIDAAI
ncbi:MAG: deoxyribodipyrimidine photo-lyase [Candidatus Protistobacter heckmanni]|nr:deoxyribodipyrimidine photo-lyase [Candidatus Protistobacter heckmanni]